MSIVGIVVLSILGGLFVAILIGAVIFLIWSVWKVNAHITSVMSDFTRLVHTHTNLVEDSESRLTSLISKINADSLEASAKSLMTILPEFRRSFLAFAELSQFILADRDTMPSNGAGLGAGLKPDEYAAAEPGESFIGTSPTTRLDLEASEAEERNSIEDRP